MGGNSGSPVFDGSGRLVGILVGGSQDFVENDDCDVSNVCPGGANCLEDGEYIVPICELLTASNNVINTLNPACDDDTSTSFNGFTSDFTSISSYSSITTFFTTNFFTSFVSTGLTSFTSFSTFETFTFSVPSPSSDAMLLIPGSIVFS